MYSIVLLAGLSVGSDNPPPPAPPMYGPGGVPADRSRTKFDTTAPKDMTKPDSGTKPDTTKPDSGTKPEDKKNMGANLKFVLPANAKLYVDGRLTGGGGAERTFY